MKVLALSLGLIVSLSTAAAAAEIYGNVRSDIKGTRAELEVQVRCFATKEPRTYNTFTDDKGYYRVIIPTTGECALKVVLDGAQSDDVRVFLFEKPVRFDVIVRRRQEDGKYYLIRE